MKGIWRRAGAVGLVAVVAATVQAPPASATVHEIVGQWCSGRGELAPPGISGGSNADNVAKPLNANGFVTGVIAFDPPGNQPPGFLIDMDFDHPASKTVGSGVFVIVGQTQAGPLYLQMVSPDGDFPAFSRCPKLHG